MTGARLREKTTDWWRRMKWKGVLLRLRGRSKQHCYQPVFLRSHIRIPPSLWACLSISPSALLSTPISLTHLVAPSTGAQTRPSLSSPFLLQEAVSRSQKSGAAVCVPAGSEALTNGRSARPLTSNRTSWHCKSPLDKESETWCSWQRHSGLYTILLSSVPGGHMLQERWH